MDISSLMSSFGTYTPPTTNNTEEQKMNNEQKLASIEMQKMASSISLLGGTSSIDPQTLNQSIGQATDDYMLSEEAQEEMINISGTKGNDNIKASINEETGNIIFNINGKEQEYTADEIKNGIKIRKNIAKVSKGEIVHPKLQKAYETKDYSEITYGSREYRWILSHIEGGELSHFSIADILLAEYQEWEKKNKK